MSAAALLAQAKAAGLALLLAPPDNIVVRGPADARARLLPEIRAHKAALVALLNDTHRLWTIIEPSGTSWSASFTPPKDREAVLKGYPPGTKAAPCPSATQPQGRPLTSAETALVGAALDGMGEDDVEIRAEVLAKCADDPVTLAYWLGRAPDPRAALYREWLSGIDEHRALLTLDEAQVRQAVVNGVVSRETARASVLLLIRAPQGEAGQGAVGLMAVPKEKYADFGPSAALEAMQWTH